MPANKMYGSKMNPNSDMSKRRKVYKYKGKTYNTLAEYKAAKAADVAGKAGTEKGVMMREKQQKMREVEKLAKERFAGNLKEAEEEYDKTSKGYKASIKLYK
jgi:hypothetical protein